MPIDRVSKRIPMLAMAVGLTTGGPVAADSMPYAIEPSESEILVRTDRSGLLSFAGHRHVIRADRFGGRIEWAADGPPTYVKLSIEAASLRVVDDDLDSSKVVQVQEEMETSVLEVETFPRITFESIEIERLDDEDRYKIQGTLSLHGVARQLELLATMTREEGTVKLEAEVEVKQKDHDIDRVSVGLGTVKVKNEVKLVFSLVGHPWETLDTDIEDETDDTDDTVYDEDE